MSADRTDQKYGLFSATTKLTYFFLISKLNYYIYKIQTGTIVTTDIKVFDNTIVRIWC